MTPADATAGPKHAAEKALDRTVHGQAPAGKVVGVTEMPLPNTSASQRSGSTKTIGIDGRVSLSLSDGTTKNLPNLFDMVTKQIPKITNHQLIDVLIVTDYTGAVLARFERSASDNTWTKQ